jgi:hypothetical protein
MYQTKVARPEHKRAISEAEAYRRATPAQRRYWFPDGAPSGAKGTLPPSAASWDDGPDAAGLERARRAGIAALAAGYGGVLPDGQAPCGVCPACDAGLPAHCRRPLSKAEARLRSAQLHDADRTRAEVVLAELGGLSVELAARLG